jgi:hypothetical protein
MRAGGGGVVKGSASVAEWSRARGGFGPSMPAGRVDRFRGYFRASLA